MTNTIKTKSKFVCLLREKKSEQTLHQVELNYDQWVYHLFVDHQDFVDQIDGMEKELEEV